MAKPTGLALLERLLAVHQVAWQLFAESLDGPEELRAERAQLLMQASFDAWDESERNGRPWPPMVA